MRKLLLSTALAALLSGAGVANASVWLSSDMLSFEATASPFTAVFSWVDAFSTKDTKGTFSTVEADGKYSWSLIAAPLAAAKKSNKVLFEDTNVDDSISRDAAGVLSGSFEHTFSGLEVGKTYQLFFQGKWTGVKDNGAWKLIEPSVSVAAAVPEPETYAMLLAGLGLMGTIARRRSKAKSV